MGDIKKEIAEIRQRHEKQKRDLIQGLVWATRKLDESGIEFTDEDYVQRARIRQMISFNGRKSQI